MNAQNIQQETFENRLSMAISNPENLGLPVQIKLLAIYLRDNFYPCNDDNQNVIYRTSHDFVTLLRDMVNLTENDVTNLFLFLGFRISKVYNPCWCMMP